MESGGRGEKKCNKVIFLCCISLLVSLCHAWLFFIKHAYFRSVCWFLSTCHICVLIPMLSLCCGSITRHYQTFSFVLLSEFLLLQHSAYSGSLSARCINVIVTHCYRSSAFTIQSSAASLLQILQTGYLFGFFCGVEMLRSVRSVVKCAALVSSLCFAKHAVERMDFCSLYVEVKAPPWADICLGGRQQHTNTTSFWSQRDYSQTAEATNATEILICIVNVKCKQLLISKQSYFWRLWSRKRRLFACINRFLMLNWGFFFLQRLFKSC